MTGIIRKGYDYGHKLGLKMGEVSEIDFKVSNRQHSRIMEILGIKSHETKKEFKRYSLNVCLKH